MLRRDIEQLAIYQINEETDTLSVECLRDLYLKKTSEIIYIMKDGRLYGIVSSGDILRHLAEPETGAKVNKTFTVLNNYNVIRAHEIFRERSRIHKIPIVNVQGKLLGDYSRWDDILYIERNQERFMQKEAVQRALKPYETVYVVEPVANKKSYYLQLTAYLEQFEIPYTILGKEQIGEKKLKRNICIFLDEDEKRGMQCLHKIVTDKYGNIICYNGESVNKEGRFVTYKDLLFQIICETRLQNLDINEIGNILYDNVDEKTTVLFRAMERNGVNCFCLYYDEAEPTEYCWKFRAEVSKRLSVYPISTEEPWPKKSENEDFYGELYQNDDYEKEIAQKEIVQLMRESEHKENVVGKYFNAKDGRRITCFQPEEYEGTIYLLGPCTVKGFVIEDQYTIGSYLQKKLLEHGYDYRVENYGTILRMDGEIEKKLQKIGRFSKNDIVITISGYQAGEPVNVKKKSLGSIFDKYRIPSGWVTDIYMHCNHKVNNLIADTMLEMIAPWLKNKMNGNFEKVQINLESVMGNYVERQYLNYFFEHFPSDRYDTIGAVVMNCNPFSKGHRYLIEKAKEQVEFLIVFAVEEDRSLFPFEERFKMITEGTKDLDNVMVVPSGDFILSFDTFPEYFSKELSNEVYALNAKYDIEMFADYIAKPLHITHRFVGEEPEDKVTGIYNETMKKILPQRGITLIEIPRVAMGDEVVSASRVRKYLKDEEYEKAFLLLPETTKSYLMKQI